MRKITGYSFKSKYLKINVQMALYFCFPHIKRQVDETFTSQIYKMVYTGQENTKKEA